MKECWMQDVGAGFSGYDHGIMRPIIGMQDVVAVLFKQHSANLLIDVFV